jgi:hypothetical protein
MVRSLAFLKAAVVCEPLRGPKDRPDVVRIVDVSGRVSVWRLATGGDVASKTFYVKE